MSERDDLIALIDELYATGRSMRGYEARALVAGIRQTASVDAATAGLTPDDFSPDGMKIWARRMVDLYGGTAKALSVAADLTPSFLADFIRKEENKGMGSQTIGAIIAACRRSLAKDMVP